jgi:hypothetical protein
VVGYWVRIKKKSEINTNKRAGRKRKREEDRQRH